MPAIWEGDDIGQKQFELYSTNSTGVTDGITIEREIIKGNLEVAKEIPVGTPVTYNWCQKTVYPCRIGYPLALPTKATVAVSMKNKQWFRCEKGNTGSYYDRPSSKVSS